MCDLVVFWVLMGWCDMGFCGCFLGRIWVGLGGWFGWLVCWYLRFGYAGWGWYNIGCGWVLQVFGVFVLGVFVLFVVLGVCLSLASSGCGLILLCVLW